MNSGLLDHTLTLTHMVTLSSRTKPPSRLCSISYYVLSVSRESRTQPQSISTGLVSSRCSGLLSMRTVHATCSKYLQFKAQIILKLDVDKASFPEPSSAVGYLIGRLKGDAFNQIFPFIKNGIDTFKTINDVFIHLDQAYADKVLGELHNMRMMIYRNLYTTLYIVSALSRFSYLLTSLVRDCVVKCGALCRATSRVP